MEIYEKMTKAELLKCLEDVVPRDVHEELVKKHGIYKKGVEEKDNEIKRLKGELSTIQRNNTNIDETIKKKDEAYNTLHTQAQDIINKLNDEKAELQKAVHMSLVEENKQLKSALVLSFEVSDSYIETLNKAHLALKKSFLELEE
jgi:predicted nuclease with TOPRIM domain